MKKQLQGGAMLLLATVIWGSAFVSQSIAMDHMGPFTFQAIRSFLAVIGMIPVILIFDFFKQDGKNFFCRWADPRLWKAGVLCGLPLFLACNLQQVGLVEIDPGKSGFLTAMYIIIVPIIGIFRKKKPTIMIPISVAIAVIGLYFLSFAGVAKINLNDLLTLGCAFFFAVQITFVDMFANNVDPLRLNAIQASVCALLSAVVMCFTEHPTWTGIAASVLPLAHVGFLSMGLAYSLQILGQRDLEPSAASLIMSMESVFALICGILLAKEDLSGWKLLGCLLIFVAVILSQIPVRKRASV